MTTTGLKKNRIFYLDFVRAIATIAIILTHFNALYVYNVMTPAPQKAVITLNVANIYIGAFGVSLFFIISGAALMYVYDNKIEIPKFYKKRLMGIYPMFWMAFIFAAIYRYHLQGTLGSGAPIKNFIYTVLGIDMYVANFGIVTFAQVGEWFIAVIIMMYLLFPLLRWAVRKNPIIAFGVAVIVAIISTVLWDKSIEVFARVPEFMFGMIFVKYIKKVNWKMVIPAVVIIALNTVFKPTWYNNFQTFYIGVSSFIILVFIAQFIKVRWIQNICSVISKYSYACFLVHHFIIYRVAERVDLNNISRRGSYMLFMWTLCLIVFFSWALQSLYDNLRKMLTAENRYM